MLSGGNCPTTGKRGKETNKSQEAARIKCMNQREQRAEEAGVHMTEGQGGDRCMEKEDPGKSLRVPGTLTRDLTMMPVWKSLGEGETFNPQDYQEQCLVVTQTWKRGIFSIPKLEKCVLCVREVNCPGS